jgi:hypothetical protein
MDYSHAELLSGQVLLESDCPGLALEADWERCVLEICGEPIERLAVAIGDLGI